MVAGPARHNPSCPATRIVLFFIVPAKDIMNQKSLFITDYLQRRAQLTPDRIAIRDTIVGVEYTYADWNAQANRTANYLRSIGVQTGDRIAVYSTNNMPYLDIWMA